MMMSRRCKTARRVGAAAAVAAVLLGPPSLAAQRAGGPAERLGWLAGCWSDVSGDRVTEEHWMGPRGGMLLGGSRTVAGGRTVAYEQVRVFERGGVLVFNARPSGQAEAEFAQVELTDSAVAFENPKHDFPQRVVYRLRSDGSLAARIEGTQGGERRAVDFPMRRVACAGGG